MARVAHSDWFGRGRERELVVGARVAEDLAAVPAMVLSSGD